MFSPPKIHPFEENYIQKMMMNIEEIPIINFDTAPDI